MAVSSQTSGSPIRRRREALGLKPAQVAAAADISVQHLYNLEAGRPRPSLDLARRLAGVLGVSVDELFPTDPPPDAHLDAAYEESVSGGGE